MVGTVMDRTQPAYQSLIHGESYTGKAIVFGRDFMVSYHPVKDAHGRVIAMLGLGVDFTEGLKALTEQVLKIRIGKTGYVYAMDAKPGPEQGTNRIHPTLTGKSFIDLKDANGFEFIRDIITRKDGITRYSWINKVTGETRGREKIAAFGYLKDWDWVVVAGSYTDELNSVGAFLRNSMLAATLLVVVILVSMFVIMMNRWVSKPLQKAVLVTDKLAAGDFSGTTDFNTDDQPTENEVELLERGIQRMANSLRGLLEKIHISATQLAAASEQISASASHSSESARRQSDQTTQVATAMLEMSATVVEVSNNSQQAADAARGASDTARNGGKVVSETLATMRSIATSTNAAASKIGELGKSSERIGAIAAVIDDIADQTNLLALNAAIEAARAGEQGRGFAVVADEVRKLAERTASATREIAGMIENIQKEAREAVTAMQSGTHEVELGVAKTEGSGKALDQIIEMASRVGDMVSQIATAAIEQSATAEQVNANIANIAEMASQSTTNADETSKACTDLADLAISMQTILGNFKLNSSAERSPSNPLARNVPPSRRSERHAYN
jgi:methyl-accepting chemotaxis protein-2 (aspartate sensor receptor)